MRPIIAMLSDFGTRDHYAGVMKGVVLGICPDVTLVDVSHDLPAHDIPSAARELAATYKFFPAATIFLVVIDPGVGTQRRGIAADAGDWRVRGARQRGADGGLSGVAAQARRRADRAPLRAPDGEPDVRRPRSVRAGGGLARAGVHLTAFGRAITDYQMLDLAPPRVQRHRAARPRSFASIALATS